MGVRTELDTITGVERVVFEIRDRSPRELTTEMLRGGHIEEGLGLTAELVTRYEGSLEVTDDCPGWSKAVVVKLPAA